MQTADFTIAEFLAWARGKLAGETYNYGDSRNCAICQFCRDTGRSDNPAVSPYLDRDDRTAGWRHEDESYSKRREYPYELEHELVAGTWTYGALVARLEKLCPETVVAPNEWTQLDAYLTDIDDVARERCSA